MPGAINRVRRARRPLADTAVAVQRTGGTLVYPDRGTAAAFVRGAKAAYKLAGEPKVTYRSGGTKSRFEKKFDGLGPPPKRARTDEIPRAVPGTAPPPVTSRSFPFQLGRQTVTPMVMDGGGAQGGYNQHEQLAIKTGRTAKESQIARTLLNNNVDLYTGQFKGLAAGTWTGDKGYWNLSHRIDVDSNLRWLPYYMVDVTHLPSAGDACMHHMAMYSSNMGTGSNDGRIVWQQQLGTSRSAGSTTLVPDLIYSRNNTSVPDTPTQVHIGGISMKMNLYGQTLRPVTVETMLVKFKDDNFTPINDTGLASESTAVNDLAMSLFQPQIKPLIANPIADQVGVLKSSGWKIIKRKQFEIGPISSDQSDPDPHCITVNWFHNYNKLCNLRKYTPVAADDARVADPNIQESDSLGSLLTASYTPFARDRLYLVIRAKMYTAVSSTSENLTNAQCPSFDLNVKTTFRSID